MSLFSAPELKQCAVPRITGPAVYVLFLGETVVYVGCSTNALSRIGWHGSGKKHRKDFDSFAIIPVPDGLKMEDMEREYIAALKPTINVISLFPTTFDPAAGEKTPLDRAMKRIASGQTPYSAAKAEGIDPQRIYGTKAYRAWKDEADKLLLQSRDAEPSKEGFRGHWNVNLRIHQARNRSST